MPIKKYTYEFFELGQDQHIIHVENDNLKVLPEVPATPLEVVDNAPKPAYTEEEMQNAKNLAREDGLRQGQELAKSQFLDAEVKKTETLMVMIQQIEQKILEVAMQTRQKLSGVANELKPLVLAVVKKIGNADSAEVFLREQIEKLSSKGVLKIYAGGANTDMLAGKFKDAEIIADEKLQNGDFRIEWDGGFAERKTEDIWQEIENILRK